MKPKVSVIIPCWGVEKYLDRCMESVVNQTLHDIEIILVDDVSPDKVPQMCDSWKKKDPRVKVIHKKQNEGLGYARNSGLEVATGEYVAFIDSDDFVDLRMYEILYDKAKNFNYDVVYCNCNKFYSSEKIIQRKDVSNEKSFVGRSQVDNFLLDIVGPMPSYPHDIKYMMSVWHAVYRRSIIIRNEISFVSERQFISEDLFFDIDYLRHAESVCYLPDCLYYYVCNPTSLTRLFDENKKTRQFEYAKALEKKLANIFSYEQYILHYQRYLFFLLRFNIKQMVKTGAYAEDIKHLINDPIFDNLFKTYPYNKMPMKHLLTYYLIKSRYITLVRLLFSIL